MVRREVTAKAGGGGSVPDTPRESAHEHTCSGLNPAACTNGAPEAARHTLQWQVKFSALGPRASQPTLPQVQEPFSVAVPNTAAAAAWVLRRATPATPGPALTRPTTPRTCSGTGPRDPHLAAAHSPSAPTLGAPALPACCPRRGVVRAELCGLKGRLGPPSQATKPRVAAAAPRRKPVCSVAAAHAG